METDVIAAPRTVWMAVMELSRSTDMTGAEMIASLSTTRQDFESKPFLAMHLKFIQAVQMAFEQETAEKLTERAASPDEAEVEIDFTLAEATYLSLVIKIADFKGSLSLKKNLWRVIANLATGGEQT